MSAFWKWDQRLGITFPAEGKRGKEMMASNAWLIGLEGRLAGGTQVCAVVTPSLAALQLVPWQDHEGAGRAASLPTGDRPVPGAGEHQLPRGLHTVCEL